MAHVCTVGQVTPTMLVHLRYGTFLFFGVSVFLPSRTSPSELRLLQIFSFVGGLFVLFFVPETKALTLEEMDEVFGSAGLAAAEDAQRAEIAQRIGLMKYTDKGPEHTDRAHDEKNSLEVDAEKQ